MPLPFPNIWHQPFHHQNTFSYACDTARSSAGIVDSMHHETLGQLDGFAFMACWLHGHTLKTPILSNHILSMCADHLTLLSLCLSNKAEYSLECFNLRLSAHSSLLGVRWQKATRSFHARNLVNLCDCPNPQSFFLWASGNNHPSFWCERRTVWLAKGNSPRPISESACLLFQSSAGSLLLLPETELQFVLEAHRRHGRAMTSFCGFCREHVLELQSRD